MAYINIFYLNILFNFQLFYINFCIKTIFILKNKIRVKVLKIFYIIN